MPRTYVQRATRQIFSALCAILLLIEAIFLAERFTSILESALAKQANLLDVFLMLTYTVPEVFDLALPVALLIAVYRVQLHLRENRELLVLAGTGIGAHQLIRPMIAIAIFAQLASFTVSGFIEPYARFAQRSVLFGAEYRALLGGLSTGQFYIFPNATVFARAQQGGERSWLFIHQVQPDDSDRVITADGARLEGPDAQGRLQLRLDDFVTNNFIYSDAVNAATQGQVASADKNACRACRFRTTNEPVWSGRTLAQNMSTDELLKFEPRGYALAEWTTFELIGLTASPVGPQAVHLADAGRRFARSLLCLIAPVIALLALSLTSKGTQLFVLPAACAALVCVDLTAAASVKYLALAGLPVMAGVLLAAAAAIILLTLQNTIARQGALVKPALASL